MRAQEAAFQLRFGRKAVRVRVPNGGLYEVKRILDREDGHMTIVLGQLVNEDRERRRNGEAMSPTIGTGS